MINSAVMKGWIIDGLKNSLDLGAGFTGVSFCEYLCYDMSI